MPLDGTIVYGEAQVSMQHITGEAMPSRKGKGDAVPAGAPADCPSRGSVNAGLRSCQMLVAACLHGAGVHNHVVWLNCAGSQNHDGILVIRATALSDDSTPARISRMAADAQVLGRGWTL